MPTTDISLCWSCKKYIPSSSFAKFRDVCNRRCISCVELSQLRKMENPEEPRKYAVFLHPQIESRQYLPLVQFYGELKRRGVKLEHEAAVPFVPLATITTGDIQSVGDRIYQMIHSDLSGVALPFERTEVIRRETGELWTFHYKFKLSPQWEKFLKDLCRDFPRLSTDTDRQMTFLRNDFLEPYVLRNFLLKMSERGWSDLWEIGIWELGEEKIDCVDCLHVN